MEAAFLTLAWEVIFGSKKRGMTADEEVVLDVPTLAKNYKIYIVRGTAMATDNNHYAYGVDTGVTEDQCCTLRIFPMAR